MSSKAIVWSPSRVRMLNECPRRYVHFHIFGRGGWPDGPNFSDPEAAVAWRLGSRRPHRDLMIRAVADGIRDWVQMKYRGEELREASCRNMIEAHIRNSLESQDEECEREQIKQMVDAAWSRIDALSRAPILSLLNTPRVDEWMPLNRLRPHYRGSTRLYSSPDLLAKVDGRWHLVRLSCQIGKRIPNDVQQLELGAMLQWAIGEQGLPNSPSDFIVQRIGWLGHRWLSWRQKGDDDWHESARRMVAMDTRELSFANSLAGPLGDLDIVATSNSKRNCQSCGFRESCTATLC